MMASLLESQWKVCMTRARCAGKSVKSDQERSGSKGAFTLQLYGVAGTVNAKHRSHGYSWPAARTLREFSVRRLTPCRAAMATWHTTHFGSGSPAGSAGIEHQYSQLLPVHIKCALLPIAHCMAARRMRVACRQSQ